MHDQDRCLYGDAIAQGYDTWFGDLPDTEGTVAVLAELARGGPALELGIGTGRVALPLAGRGIQVHGVDASEAMVARLRAKPGGDRVRVTIGDFSDVPVEGTFTLVYAVTGTFFELQSQEAQVRCFQNVARRLEPGGRFVLDGLLPDAHVTAGDQGLRVLSGRDGQLVLNVRTLDRAEQRLVSQYVIISENGVDLVRVPFRYAWPGELDLMARLAGLRLVERMGNWRGAPFTAASRVHVSVYERAA